MSAVRTHQKNHCIKLEEHAECPKNHAVSHSDTLSQLQTCYGTEHKQDLSSAAFQEH